MPSDLIGKLGKRLLLTVLLLALAAFGAACGDDDTSSTSDDSTPDSTGTSTETSEEATGTEDLTGTIRLAYFPNITHAPAILAVQEGLFEAALGEGVDIEYVTFNSGTEAVEALFSGAIDASFIGPNPAINAFAQSDGEAVRIVSGTTSGGASLVVREGIDAPEDLAGAKLASPSLGNTQDVALRAWLTEQGYETDTTGGGDVSITPQENADTLATFQDGQIDGAWVPEPWATRLIQEGGGHVLVNESELWPGGDFVTTHLIVATKYLDENPGIVKGVISGLLDAIDLANEDATAAQTTENAGIKEVTTKELPAEVISAAWENLRFTADPVASSLSKSKDDAVAAGLLDDVDLEGIYDLTLLNELLTERGEDEVEGL
jgi:NitT/TauT family transport system substrate-binding protein